MAEQGGGIQEGVANAGDLKASQRGAGANPSADVAVGAAWIQLDTGSRNGIGHVFSDAVFNAGPFTGGHATLPRVDQVIARWNDSSIPTGTGNTLTIEVLTGTATSGAQISNTAGANYRAGATALPNDCLRIADVLMPALASSVTTANIVDRRPWAKGAVAEATTTGGNQALPVGTLAAITTISAAVQQRVECSGVPLWVEINARTIAPASAGGYATLMPAVDGAVASGIGTDDLSMTSQTAAAATETKTRRYRFTPASGSHLITIWARVSSGTGTIISSAAEPVRITIQEDVRQTANNGTA